MPSATCAKEKQRTESDRDVSHPCLLPGRHPSALLAPAQESTELESHPRGRGGPSAQFTAPLGRLPPATHPVKRGPRARSHSSAAFATALLVVPRVRVAGSS